MIRHKHAVCHITDNLKYAQQSIAMAFITEALLQLAWINSHLECAEGTDKRALECARDELTELVWVSLKLEELSSSSIQ